MTAGSDKHGRTDPFYGMGSDPQPGLDRARAIFREFVDAACSAAVDAAAQQKERAARQLATIAGAVRAAAHSLDRSQSPVAARYAGQAADRFAEMSQSLDERSWGAVIGDVEEVARRRPALFVAAAVAVGFLAGRFLALPAPEVGMRRTRRDGAFRPGETVTTAISSTTGYVAPGSGTGGGMDRGSGPRETT